MGVASRFGIAGETAHDRYICDSVANALQCIAVDFDIPVGFGILTCQTIEQACARAGGEKGNKGAEAMLAVLDAIAEADRVPVHRAFTPAEGEDE